MEKGCLRFIRRLLNINIIELSHQTRNICITFVQCWSNVEDVGPTFYKCYTNVFWGISLYGLNLIVIYYQRIFFTTYVNLDYIYKRCLGAR